MTARKFLPLWIVVAGLLAYGNSLFASFVFDDISSIVNNPRVRALWPPWVSMLHTFRPIVDFTFAGQYALGGLDPWGYHLGNVAIHVLAGLVLFGVMRRTLSSGVAARHYGPAADRLALAVALIWMVHPLQTESVAYVAQRAESMMGLFYLLTLYCAIRGAGASRPGIWSAMAVGSCVLGMGCKPVIATAPLTVLFYDKIFLAGNLRGALRRRWLMYLGLAATWGLLAALTIWAPSPAEQGAGFGYKGVTPLTYALTQPIVLLHYLRLSFWPVGLVIDYSWPVASAWTQILPPLLLVGTLLLGTIWALFRVPAWGFLGVWFFLTLAPSSSFIPLADLAAEHRMYLSLAAVAVLFVLGVWVIARRRAPIFLGVVALLTVGLMALTFARNRDYGSELVMWQDTILKRPGNARALINAGGILVKQHRIDEAISYFLEALQHSPDHAMAHCNLGLAKAAQGRWEEAHAEYEKALELKPDYAEAHNNLGILLFQQGRVDEARAHYAQALAINPDHVAAQVNLGNLLFHEDKLAEAVARYEIALKLDPDIAETHNNHGMALFKLGKVEDAIRHYAHALQLNPDYAEAHHNMGLALRQQGKAEEATRHFQAAGKK